MLNGDRQYGVQVSYTLFCTIYSRLRRFVDYANQRITITCLRAYVCCKCVMYVHMCVDVCMYVCTYVYVCMIMCVCVHALSVTLLYVNALTMHHKENRAAHSQYRYN